MPAICEIKGTVVDSTTGFPIEYASISVLDQEAVSVAVTNLTSFTDTGLDNGQSFLDWL